MTINHPPKQSEYEPPAPEKQEGFIDQFLIRIGDIVIKNFAFLVLITAIWGVFLLLLFGGIMLIYSVGERFWELDEREQKRVILQEQQFDQIFPPHVELKNEAAAKLDESDWFVVLSDSAEAANLNQTFSIEIDNLIEGNTSVEQPEHEIRQLVTAENVWKVRCGSPGFVIEESYPCPISQSELLEPMNLEDDIAVSN